MALYLGKKWTKAELLSYVGDPAQVAGTRVYEYATGKAQGVKGIDMSRGAASLHRPARARDGHSGGVLPGRSDPHGFGHGDHAPRLLRGAGSRVAQELQCGAAHDLWNHERGVDERGPGRALRHSRKGVQRRGGKPLRRPALGRRRVRYHSEGEGAGGEVLLREPVADPDHRDEPGTEVVHAPRRHRKSRVRAAAGPMAAIPASWQIAAKSSVLVVGAVLDHPLVREKVKAQAETKC
jgi:hypothetical protein